MTTAPNKVVIVPGLGGTTLYYKGGFGGFTNYWYNPTIMLSSNPLVPALASDGVSPYPLLGKQLYPGGPVDMGIYEPLITALANGGYNPVFYGYDWRLNLQATAQAFANYLRSANLTNPFSVVCHSMGGLVAQLAYPAYQALSPTNVWGKTVYVGTPQGGSSSAASTLAGLFPNSLLIAVLKTIFGFQSPLGGGVFAPTLTAIQKAIAISIASWPSLYQLLPNPGGPWKILSTFASELLEAATYIDPPAPISQGWLNLAKTVQDQVVTGLTTARPAEVGIYGTGFSTQATYQGTPADPGLVTSYATADGDNVVEAARAVLGSESATINVEGIAHLDLVRSESGTQAILAALFVTPSTGYTIPFDPPAAPPAKQPPSAPIAPVITNPFANTHGDP